MTAGLAHRIAIHAADDIAREALLDLQFLRAESLIAHRRFAAQWTVALRLLLEAAVMAEHDVALFVIGQSQVAEAAGFDVAARGAMHVCRETAAIEEQHHLTAVLEGRAHGLFERIAEG